MSTNPKIFIKRLIEKLNDKDLIIEQQKSFIQQQDKMLEKACLMIAEHEDCPLDATGVRKYLQSEVGK